MVLRSARPLAALLLAASLASLLPPLGSAQEASSEPVLLLEDDAGDIAANVGGTPADLPAGTWDAIDLRALHVQETPTEFLVSLQATSLASTAQQTILAAVQYQAAFRHVDAIYVVRGYYSDPAQAYGVLERLPPGSDPSKDYGDYVAEVPLTVDVASNTLTWAVPRDQLVDEDGAVPYPGRVLDLFMAQAGFLRTGDIMVNGQALGGASVEDRMPDDGAGQVPLPVAFGIVQTGVLRLDSEEPFRASNGEAATFVFRVNATNLGSEEAVAEFVPVGQPAVWDVSTPGLIRLQANESVEFPIVVRTAFAHAHGTATAFTLELVGQDGVSTGRIQMGLRYPKIAQPAGHHNEVHLHNLDFSDDPVQAGVSLVNRGLGGYDNAKLPYFNTAPREEDPADAATAVPGYACEGLRIQDDNDTIGTTYCWDIPLSPALEMGLDFDLAGVGAYTIPIHSLAPQPGARVLGQIVYYEPIEQSDDPFAYFLREPIVVAELTPSDRAEIGPDGSQTFKGTIQPLEAGDFLPYVRGAGLEIHLQVRTARPDNFFLGPRTEPELVPGGHLQLPLLEYEDSIDEAYGIANVLHLVLDGDAHRMANPGDTLVYRITAHNADGDGHDFAATVLGANREWARVVGDDEFGIDADDQRTLTVAVTIPADALDGDVADLVLEVASQDDVAVRALVRLVAMTDTDEEHDDQASLLEPQGKEGKDTPALQFAPLAVGLLALAFRARSRRQP